MRKAVIMTAVGMLLVALAGCGGSDTQEADSQTPEPTLLGTWKIAKVEGIDPEVFGEAYNFELSFKPESEFSIILATADGTKSTTTGTYLVEGNKLTTTTMGKSLLSTFELRDDTLIITDQKYGGRQVFKRK